jgi:hypothetical protein
MASSDPVVRRRAASGKLTSEQADVGSIDPDDGVRLAVASNENVRAAVLEHMAATDARWRVRRAARATLRRRRG